LSILIAEPLISAVKILFLDKHDLCYDNFGFNKNRYGSSNKAAVLEACGLVLPETYL